MATKKNTKVKHRPLAVDAAGGSQDEPPMDTGASIPGRGMLAQAAVTTSEASGPPQAAATDEGLQPKPLSDELALESKPAKVKAPKHDKKEVSTKMAKGKKGDKKDKKKGKGKKKG